MAKFSKDVASVTGYFDSPKASRQVPPNNAVFVPAGFNKFPLVGLARPWYWVTPGGTTNVFDAAKTKQVTMDVLVFFHGRDVSSIASYLAQDDYRLREAINRVRPSRLILIAPHIANSEADELAKSLDDFLENTLALIQTNRKALAIVDNDTDDTTIVIDKVYVAGHSAGGAPARQVGMSITRALRAPSPQKPKYPVKEYWLFDALYGKVTTYPKDPTKKTGQQFKKEGDAEAVEEEWFEIIRTQRTAVSSFARDPDVTKRSLQIKGLVEHPRETLDILTSLNPNSFASANPPVADLKGTFVHVSSPAPTHPAVILTHFESCLQDTLTDDEKAFRSLIADEEN